MTPTYKKTFKIPADTPAILEDKIRAMYQIAYADEPVYQYIMSHPGLSYYRVARKFDKKEKHVRSYCKKLGIVLQEKRSAKV